jgi:hypothetical protein
MNKDQLREAVLGTAAWQQAGLLTEASAPTQSQETEDVAEGHTCPLCESDLGEEDLSDEELLEHAEQMLGMFEEAGQIISEQAANEAEGDEEDLLEGLDDEDIQHLVNLSREMKSEYDRADETLKRGTHGRLKAGEQPRYTPAQRRADKKREMDYEYGEGASETYAGVEFPKKKKKTKK